jgi:PAS domain S-box-containing protein/putative nucleotidyltransferase with HDIG domain
MPTAPSSPSPPNGRLLIVDDEYELMTVLSETLSREGFEVVGAGSGNEALEVLREQPPFDLLLTDLMMPGLDGLALLKAALDLDPQLVCVMMTGQGTVQTAVDAMKIGAFDYILKPFKLSAMLPVLTRAVGARRLRVENLQLRETVAIYELAQTLAVTLDAETILTKLADAALQQSEADEASVMLPEGEALRVAAVGGVGRGYILGERVPLAMGVAGWVARFREMLELKGEVRDPRFAPLHPRPEIRQALSVPMLAGNDFIGVLNVNVTRPRRPFTLRDAKALSILAGLGAAVLQNARLLAQVQADEKRFRALIQNAPDAITLLEPDGTVRYDSPAAQGLLGYSPEELLGTNAFERIHPDDRAATQAVLQQLVETPGVKRSYTFRFRHKNGDWRWMEAVGSNLLAEPSVQAIVVNYRDVTERRMAQDALRESEAMQGLILNNVDEAIYSTEQAAPNSLEGRARFVSNRADQILGYQPREFMNDPALWFSLLHPDDALATREQTAAIFASRQPGARVYRVRHKHTGEYRWIEDHVTPQVDQNGNVIGTFGVAHDITERKQAEAALRESEEYFRSLIENVSDVITVLNGDGIILYESPSIERVLGYKPEELAGQSAFELVHPDDRPGVLEAFVRGFQSPESTPLVEARTRHKDGSWRVVEMIGKPARDRSGQMIGIVNSRDVTERKRAEAALERQLQELKVLHAIATLGVEAPDEDVLIETATLVIGEAFYPDNFGVLLVDEPARVLRIHASYRGLSAEAMQIVIPLGHGVTGRVAADGRPRRIADATREPDYLDLKSAMRSELCAPLKTGERVIGVVNTESALLNAFSEDDERLLLTVAGQLATAIEGLRRAAAERERVRELETLAQVSAALRVAQTRVEMLPIVLEQLADLLKADGTALAMRDAVSGETVVELGRGRATDMTGIRLAPGAGISGQVINTGQPYLNDDARADPRFPHTPASGDLRAVACVPLMAQEQAIGALWVGRHEPGWAGRGGFGPGEVRLLSAIAEMAANAIHRAALHEQTERRLEYLAALRTVDVAISSSLDVRVTLGVLLDQTMTQLRVNAAAILLLNPALQTLDYAAGRGFGGNGITRSHLRLGECQAGRAALERRTTYLPNLAEATTFVRAGLLAGENFVTYCATPLIAKGNVIGVLEVFHRAPLSPDQEWLDFLEALAGQAAIAVENARLFESLQRSNLDLSLAYDATIAGWSRALDLRDHETEGHTQRVTELTERLARAMGLGEAELVHVRRGALLHDIGKMGVPDSILLKAGPLTDDEWKVMRLHPQLASEMLSPIAYLRPALDIPHYHHEKWDGTGYPRGLKAEQIPLAARLFAVVDVWDALRSDRPYRKGWPEDKVLEHIRSLAGTHFDPQAVEAFLKLAAEGGLP